MPRPTQAEEDALAAQMEADADDPDAWGEAEVFDAPLNYRPGHVIAVRYENELAHRLGARAKQLNMLTIDLIRLYVERGLDQDDAAEAVRAKSA